MGAAANCVGCDHEHDGEMLGRHVVSKGATIFWVIERAGHLIACQKALGRTSTRLRVELNPN